MRRVLGTTHKARIQCRRNTDCRGRKCRECKAHVHRFTMCEVQPLVFSFTSLRARCAAYEQQLLLTTSSTAASYLANNLILRAQGKRDDQVRHLVTQALHASHRHGLCFGCVGILPQDAHGGKSHSLHRRVEGTLVLCLAGLNSCEGFVTPHKLHFIALALFFMSESQSPHCAR